MLLPLALSACAAEPVAMFHVKHFDIKQDSIPAPLNGLRGEAARGRLVVLNRELGNCLICHSLSEPQERFQGNVAMPLAGVGARLDAGQIRLRVVDSTRINPASVMPPYHRVENLRDVAPEYAGRPALSAQQVEDVVAYLAGLKDEGR